MNARRDIAESRREYVPATTPIGAIARAAAFYEIEHCPKRGITSREIAEKYALGESWYEYEDSPRRVNMVEQLIRNELAKAYRAHKLVKLWSPSTGKLVRRKGHVVYVPPGIFLDLQVEHGIGMPDRKKWGFD